MPVGAYKVNLIVGSCLVVVVLPLMAYLALVNHGNNRIAAIMDFALFVAYWLTCLGLYVNQGWETFTSISVLFFA